MRDANEYNKLILNLELMFLRYKAGEEERGAFELARQAAANCGIVSVNDLVAWNPDDSIVPVESAQSTPQNNKERV